MLGAQPLCSHCGGAVSFWLTDVSEAALCTACTDRALPELRIVGLRRAFSRPRRLDGTCPFCGWTTTQLAETALVGCPLCYEALDLGAIPSLA